MGPASRIRQRAERHFRPETVNFWCHVIEGGFAMLGLQLVGQQTVLPVLITEELGGTSTTFGLVKSMIMAAFLAPLLLAPRLEGGRRRKGLILLLGIGQRLPLLVMSAAVLLLGPSNPRLCLLVIAAMLLLRAVSGQVQLPIWFDLIGETIPDHRLGWLWGYRHFLSAAMRLLAAPVCMIIISAVAFPGNYALLYFISFGAMLVSWLIFALVDDVPEGVPVRRTQPARYYFRDLRKALGADRDYRHFLLSMMIRTAGASAIPFFAIAAVKYHGVPKGTVIGAFIVAGSLGRMIGTSAAPWLADRIGHKRVIQLGNAVTMLASLVAAFAPHGRWFLFLSSMFIWGIGGSARNICAQACSLVLAPRGRRVGYKLLQSISVALVAIVLAPLMGLMMDVTGSVPVLALSVAACLNLASCLPLEHCRVPSAAELAPEEDADEEPDDDADDDADGR